MNLFVSSPLYSYECFKNAVEAYIADTTMIEYEKCTNSILCTAIFISNSVIFDIFSINSLAFSKNASDSLSTTRKLCIICFSILSVYVCRKSK